ncbi:recombinase family protein [Serratia marcescens]|uniref:recombinase family protein n=1 Tax=Serratia marcescens TaxID=615 RepID=UPI001F488291|nr:recombinase family protein [Serratia marcescens]MCF1611203.1 recombinase family protein [Serratia marcescens]HBV3813370.1 recombinase family protein [Serratia marcescens]HEO9035868.1 recombinase family protein [Serratia marcescens]
MSSKIFGYARVSTRDQNPDRQTLALVDCDEVLLDKVSGKNTDRPELTKLRGMVRAGDTVRVKSVDRLARNTKDLLDLLEEFTAKGVSVSFIDNSMTFDNSPTSKFMITMLGAVGELERSFIRQRQSEGIAAAKERGAFKGRQKDDELREKIHRYIRLGTHSNDDIIKLVGCGRATFYRIKKEFS